MIDIGPFSFEDHLDKDGDLEIVIGVHGEGYTEEQFLWISKQDAKAIIDYLTLMFEELTTQDAEVSVSGVPYKVPRESIKKEDSK